LVKLFCPALSIADTAASRGNPHARNKLIKAVLRRPHYFSDS